MEEKIGPGDLIRWNGVNGFCYGEVIKGEGDGLVVVLERGGSFRLEDLGGTVMIVRKGVKQ